MQTKCVRNIEDNTNLLKFLKKKKITVEEFKKMSEEDQIDIRADLEICMIRNDYNLENFDTTFAD